MSKTIAILAACVLIALAGTASAELTAVANHDYIEIGFMYHGSTVSVRGVNDPGTDLVIKVASPDVHQPLKQKGKVGGVLWMNVGSLKFEKVPNVYYLHSTKNIDDILAKEERDRYGLGYEAMADNAEVSPVKDEADKARWFAEFVKYKEAQHLFETTAGKIEFKNDNGKQSYYTLSNWYYQAPPGDYKVTVYAVRDGKVVETAEANVKVEQVGGVKMLANMAKNNGALYGILSILAALGAGFGVGLIFKGGGAH